MPACESRCEVYSRVVGYFRPINNWNPGKRQEFSDRLEYDEELSLDPVRGKIRFLKK